MITAQTEPVAGRAAPTRWRVVATQAAVCALLLLGLVPGAGATQVAAEQQAKISMKVLSFEETLKERAGNKIVIAVIYRVDSSKSQSEATKLAAAFNELGKKHTVHRKVVSAVTVPFDANLGQTLTTIRASALFVAAELDSEIAIIAALAAEGQLPTMCGTRRQLEKGLAFAVTAKEGKLALLVNLQAAVRLRLKLDPKLLRLAEVVK